MSEKNLQYIPGDLTDPKHRPPSYGMLRPRKQPGALFAAMDTQPKREPSANRRLPSPVTLSRKNFAQAKKCHRENLEHQPLPDMIAHAAYRRLQLQRMHDPGIGLPEEEHGATGVAWRGHAGPTQCSKMRVYRPKTTGAVDEHNKENALRPGSVNSFDMKWRFIKQKHVSPIDLAICWDMKPENPKDEPRRTNHIDGTNDSVGPAVFQIVQSPKDPATPGRSARSSSAGCEPPKTAPACHNGKNCGENHKPSSVEALHRSASTDSLYVHAASRRKVSRDTVQTAVSNMNAVEMRRRHMHGSSPNISAVTSCASDCHRRKGCRVCGDAKPTPILDARPRADYKMAFKAGVPSQRGSQDSGSTGTCSAVRVPKQRDPYAKKNYDINSLSPPFSLWKGEGSHGYPEHWRLASVYQHSYKPLEARRRRLLASVYQ